MIAVAAVFNKSIRNESARALSDERTHTPTKVVHACGSKRTKWDLVVLSLIDVWMVSMGFRIWWIESSRASCGDQP
jgi:hypothetical protein